MKKKTLEVALVDVNESQAGEALVFWLAKVQMIIRARKNCPRTSYGKKWRELDVQPPSDSWRHLLARYLRRRLPFACWIYIGGHHIAIMERTVIPFLPSHLTLARFVETTPV